MFQPTSSSLSTPGLRSHLPGAQAIRGKGRPKDSAVDFPSQSSFSLQGALVFIQQERGICGESVGCSMDFSQHVVL